LDFYSLLPNKSCSGPVAQTVQTQIIGGGKVMESLRKKKLVVFFDGTWNSADQHTRDGKACPTNITKLFEATLPQDEDSVPQIVHYVQGIGTRKIERIRGGGFGYGISDNIKEGYRFLVSNYDPGDEIYIFGFSRGAFTARSLAGLIRNTGILRRDKVSLINEAYQIYKDRSADCHPNAQSSIDFRKENTHGGETIRLLGVFDTVGALGAPFGIVLNWVVGKLFQITFHDTQLSSIVESAYHALALDERRLPFMPTLMSPNDQHNASNFEQKWFPGVHSDIGGGYANSGLSDLSLNWMADKAEKQGLHLDLNKIVNPPFKPLVAAQLNVSQTFGYRLITVLTVKLPGKIGLVPKKYAEAVPDIQWNGDYIRPVSDVGEVNPFIGNPPRPEISTYNGSLHTCVIEKIIWRSPDAPDSIHYEPRNVLNSKPAKK
jgi:hypothetical protein